MNNIEIILTVLGLVLTFAGLCLTIGLFWVAGKTNKIDQLGAELKAAAKEIIDAKFAVLAAQMNTPVSTLVTIVDEMKRRLLDGDETFESQQERMQKIELRNSAVIGELRAEMASNFVTKNEFEKLSEALHKMQTTLAVVMDRVESKIGGEQ